MGLVNRRNQLKFSLNQREDEEIVEADQSSGADAQKIEAQVGDKESSALSSLTEHLLDQEQAISVVACVGLVLGLGGVARCFRRAG